MTKLNLNLVFAIFISISLTTQAQMTPDFGARFESFSGKIPRQDVKINCMDSDGEFVYLGTENNGLLKIRYINLSPGSVVINQYGVTNPMELIVRDYKLLNSNHKVSITALTLDKDNYVWCGTKLSCFLKDTKNPDENELKKVRLDQYINNPNTRNANSIITCITTSGNMTFIGTEQGEIVDYNEKTRKYNSMGYKSEDRSRINGLIAENEKLVLIARDNGLYHRDEYEDRWIKISDINKVYKLLKTGYGTYWVVGEDKNKKIVVLRSADGFAWESFNKNLSCVAMDNTIINDIEIDEAGRNLWIATDNGLIQFNFELEFCNWYNSDKSPEINMETINDIAVQNNSTIWLSNYDGALYRLSIHPDTYEKEYLEKLKR